METRSGHVEKSGYWRQPGAGRAAPAPQGAGGARGSGARGHPAEGRQPPPAHSFRGPARAPGWRPGPAAAAGPGGRGPRAVPAGSRAGSGGSHPASPSPPPRQQGGSRRRPQRLTPVPLSHTTTFLPSVSIAATPTRLRTGTDTDRATGTAPTSAGPPERAARRARTPEAVSARRRPARRRLRPRCHGGGSGSGGTRAAKRPRNRALEAPQSSRVTPTCQICSLCSSPTHGQAGTDHLRGGPPSSSRLPLPARVSLLSPRAGEIRQLSKAVCHMCCVIP